MSKTEAVEQATLSNAINKRRKYIMEQTISAYDRLSWLVSPKNQLEREILLEAFIYANIKEYPIEPKKEKRALVFYRDKLKYITRLRNEK